MAIANREGCNIVPVLIRTPWVLCARAYHHTAWIVPYTGVLQHKSRLGIPMYDFVVLIVSADSGWMELGVETTPTSAPGTIATPEGTGPAGSDGSIIVSVLLAQVSACKVLLLKILRSESDFCSRGAALSRRK